MFVTVAMPPVRAGWLRVLPLTAEGPKTSRRVLKEPNALSHVEHLRSKVGITNKALAMKRAFVGEGSPPRREAGVSEVRIGVRGLPPVCQM